jgi:hypothetical protein
MCNYFALGSSNAPIRPNNMHPYSYEKIVYLKYIPAVGDIAKSELKSKI